MSSISTLWRHGITINGPKFAFIFAGLVAIYLCSNILATFDYNRQIAKVPEVFSQPAKTRIPQDGDDVGSASASAATPTAFNTNSDDEERLPISTAASRPATEKPGCANLPGVEDVLVVLKTGATVIYEKLPQHLLTTFRCASDFLIFSDLEQDVGPYHVYDALEQVSESVKAEHKDFEFYRKMREYKAQGMDVGTLKGYKGWDLDKWKFLPMIQRAYSMRPSTKWFLFIEADTFFSWHNLLTLLGKLDPSKPLYMGAQTMIGIEFAHGGSGIVLSNAAAKELDELLSQPGKKEEWEKKTDGDVGDKVLALALEERGIRLFKSFPNIQGETAWSLDWSPTHWCRAAVTWHHVKSSEVDAYWQFEASWMQDHSGPILFKDMYAHFVSPQIHANPTRSSWNNLSRDWKLTPTPTDKEDLKELDALEAYSSFESCRAACEAKEDCLQYMWEPEKCSMGNVVKLGKPVEASKTDDRDEDVRGEDVKSGWLLARIEKFFEKLEPCEEEKTWILHND